MNCDTTLFFPNTVVPKNILRNLLLYFSAVYHYQPTEAEETAKGGIFSASDLVKGYPPAPMGDDLERFRKMMKDLTGHEDEYYGGYLSSLSRDLLIDRDEASVWTLISNLSKKDSQAADNGPPTQVSVSREELWRSRLLLKLAESLSHREQEISQRMAELSARESDLMKSLRGEDDSSEDDLLEDAAAHGLKITDSVSDNVQVVSPSYSPIRMERLTAAWGSLYLADRNIEERPFVLTAQSMDAASPLFNAYVRHVQNEPVRLFTLNIPDSSLLDDVQYLERRKSFRSTAGDCISNLSRLLGEAADGELETGNHDAAWHATSGSHKAAVDEEKPLLIVQKEVTEWSIAIKALEESSTGGSRLSFYLFQGISPRDLFLLLRPSENAERPSSSHPPHAIVAVLEQ